MNSSEIKLDLLKAFNADGPRHFICLPNDVIGWRKLYKYLGKLDGVKTTGFLTDYLTEVWMDFTYRGHDFTVTDSFGEYWFTVSDPLCPQDVLLDIARHCEHLLNK